jgi:hypothetical protein
MEQSRGKITGRNEAAWRFDLQCFIFTPQASRSSVIAA